MNNTEENDKLPYRASANLNTSIGNPNIDVNNTMNINIHSVNVDSKMNDDKMTNSENNAIGQDSINVGVESSGSVPQIKEDEIELKDKVKDSDLKSDSEKEDKQDKNYVSNNTTGKKKTQIKFGSEFRFVFLILVLLLIFVFILPIISDVIGN